MRIFHSALLLFLIVGSGNLHAQTEWVEIFDGKTLDGWTQKGGEAKYEVEDGVIVGTTVPDTKNSFLCTEKRYGDFELELEFKVHHELNSGIQFRSNSLEEYRSGRVHGYQCEIDPSDRSYTAGIYDEARRGWLMELADNYEARAALKLREWNELRIRAVGDRIKTWINGVPASLLIDDMTAEGFIALQVHGVGARKDPLDVRWRNIRIRENPPADEAEAAIRKLIPESTAIDRDQFTRLTRGEAGLNMSMSLTLAAMSNELAAEDFQYIGAIEPAKVAAELSGGALISFFREDRITGFDCVAGEQSAHGWVHSEIEGMLKARAKFRAEKSEDGNWQITRLSMPASRLTLIRDDDGEWIQRGKFKGKVFTDRKVKLIADGFRFTEGPAVSSDGEIYFHDIPESNLHVFEPGIDETRLVTGGTEKANGLFIAHNGALIICKGGGRKLTRLMGVFESTLAETFEGKKLNSPNDLVLDNAGNVYFTDPRYGNRDNMEMEVEGVYFVNRKNEISRVIDDMERPNGLIFSPDFKTLYVADHGGGKTCAYDVPKPGQLENKREFAGIGSDGMSVDRMGNIYLTWDKSVHVFNGAGDLIDKIEIPEKPTNCVLVGSTLYVTARTGFYSVETNQTGMVK